MKRQQKRQQARQYEKYANKTYTFNQLVEFAKKIQEDTINMYDDLFTDALVNALNAEPFRFGKKRIAQVLEMLFGQVEGVILGTIDKEMIKDTARSLGIITKHVDNSFVINIEDKANKLTKPNLNTSSLAALITKPKEGVL